jgi:hypothetical protein
MAEAPKSSGPASTYREQSQASSGGSAAAATLLRRRKEGKSAFGAASRAIGAMMDITKKVRLDAITASLHDAFTGDQRKRQQQTQQAQAPPGVTHAYSAVLTHITAPTWSIGAKPIGVEPAILFNDAMVVSFCRSLDAKGWDVELVSEILSQDPVLTTVYIALLLAKLLCLENGEWRLNFFELAAQITRDVKHRKDYEEHPNDEQVALDQPRRRLIEVGGSWRPRGAVELAAPLNALRQQCLTRCMYASVCFKYQYTDENVQSLVDALASQLFLVNYSESVVHLVAGVKGSSYLAKYFVHIARPSSEACDLDGFLVEPNVRSTALEAVNAAIDLAVSNVVHRNDTGEIVIMALIKALDICPPKQLRSLIKVITEVFGLICIPDLTILVQLLDSLRAFMLQPNPVGKEAYEATKLVWSALRNVGSPSRAVMSTLFVAGNDMRSFRRRPAHVLTSPYCARAYVFTKILHADVGQQRGANPLLPVALPRNVDPKTGGTIHGMLDDAVLYVANQVSNIFQSALELTSHIAEEDLAAMQSARRKNTRLSSTTSTNTTASMESEEDLQGQMASAIANVQLIDLPTLFSIQPMSLCGFLPMLHLLLHPKNPETIFSDPMKTKPDIFARIAEQYLVLVDGHKPVKGQRRFRLEAPHLPLRPLLLNVVTESDDMLQALKGVIDRHWKYCDQRITDRDPAHLHPKRDLSLSHFIENDIDLVIVGGTGTLRRMCETILRLRLQYPGAVPLIRLFVIPAGYDNDIASWLARHDPLYLHRVFAPFSCLPAVSVEPLSSDALNASAPPTMESLSLRNRVDSYLVHGTATNELVVFQVECVNPDGTSIFLAMSANFEFGAHVTAAVISDGFTCSKENLSTASLMPASAVTRGASATAGGGAAAGSPRLGRTKSSISTASFSSRPAMDLPFVELEAEHVQRLQPIATGFVEQHTTLSFLQLCETIREPIERILVRMHATFRGLALATRKHPSEGKDVPFCCSGTDVLDWISTTYHLYDAKAANGAAQRLLDRGVISCAGTAAGKAPDRFTETSLYIPRPREEPDAVPTGAAAARSATYDLALSMKQSVEEAKANRQAANSGIPFAVKARVAFVPRSRDPQYLDLMPTMTTTASTGSLGPTSPDGKSTVREIALLKVKSVGATGDRGAEPSPINCSLQLAVYDMERKRSAAMYEINQSTGPLSPLGQSSTVSASPSPDRRDRSGTDNAAAAGAQDKAAAPVNPSNVGLTPELGDHYTLSFGNGTAVDPRCVLSIDVVDDGVLAAIGPGAGGSVGVHCVIDGDIFGPFIGFRLRPALSGTGEGPATIPIMSFLPCDSSTEPS